MPRRLPDLPRLGELELAVLHHFWAIGDADADVQEVHAAVGRARGITVNTVGSAVERMYRKGVLAREKISHAFRYRPVLDQEAFRARKVVEAAGGLQALGKSGLLAAFVDLVADADRDALAQLEQLVKSKRANDDSEPQS